MNKLLLLFILFVAAVLQSAVFSQITILDNHYEFFFSIVVFIGIRYNWYEGCISGIWCGLLNDVFTAGTFGMSVFIFTLSGFIASFFQKIVFTQHIATRLFILFIMSIFATVLTIFLLNDSSIFFKAWKEYKLSILSIALLNTAFSIPVYYLLDRMSYEPQR